MILHNSSQTQQFGKEFAQNVQHGGVICLYGDLGAGKTTFTQGLAQGLEIEKRIISPTFVIVRIYTMPLQQGEREKNGQFYHIDLYRTNNALELEELGLHEILANPYNIVVIEWPENAQGLLPQPRWEIHLQYLSEHEREITVTHVA